MIYFQENISLKAFLINTLTIYNYFYNMFD